MAAVIDNLYNHVKALSVDIGERHLWMEGSLDRTADYIESIFSGYGYDVSLQTFSAYGKKVSNLIAEKTGSEKGLAVIGAHYDTVPGSPGADDNASAVAGLLELANLFREVLTRKTLRFVAFVNEEPPCFGSDKMGSMVYARTLREQGVFLEVMISLEMIGFYSNDRIQRFPLPGMHFFYPRTADFVAVAGNLRSSRYVRLLKKGIRKHSTLDAGSLTAPEYVGGINLSDNYSFWHNGYRAVMITDTSFFRNRNYHQETDMIDTLDFKRMADLVEGLFRTLADWSTATN